MRKFVVILLLAVTFSLSKSYKVKRQAPLLYREFAEQYLRQLLDELEPYLKPVFDQWASNLYGPFEKGPNFGLSDAFVRRDAPAPSAPNALDSFQKHMEQFKTCIDQSLAKTVDDVNVKQIQPVFQVFGEQLNKISKAFEDLTATKTSS